MQLQINIIQSISNWTQQKSIRIIIVDLADSWFWPTKLAWLPHCLSGFTASLQVTRSLFSASGLKMGGLLSWARCVSDCQPLALSAMPQDNDVCVKSFTTLLLSPTTGPLGRDPCARWDTPGVSCQVVCVHLHNLRTHSIQRAAPPESA